jgi:hypothetical protein
MSARPRADAQTPLDTDLAATRSLWLKPSRPLMAAIWMLSSNGRPRINLHGLPSSYEFVIKEKS